MNNTGPGSIKALLVGRSCALTSPKQCSDPVQGSLNKTSKQAAKYCAGRISWLVKAIPSLVFAEPAPACAQKGLERVNGLLQSSKGVYATSLRSPQYTTTFLVGGDSPKMLTDFVRPIIRNASLQLLVSKAKQKPYVVSSGASTFPYGSRVAMVFDELSENKVKKIADRNIGTSNYQNHFGPGYFGSLAEGQEQLASQIRERGEDIKTEEVSKFCSTILGQQVNETVANVGIDDLLMLELHYHKEGVNRSDPEHIFLELSKQTSQSAAQKLAELKQQSRDTRFSKVNWADVQGTAIYLTTHAKLEQAAGRSLALGQRNHMDGDAEFEPLVYPSEILELAKNSEYDSEYSPVVEQAQKSVKLQLAGRVLMGATVAKVTGLNLNI